MKVFALLVCSLLVLSLSSPIEGRLFLTNRSSIFCVWSAKKSCSKTTPVCVVVQATATCKYYRNECQYSIDNCLGKTVYGQTGVIDPTLARCVGVVPLGGTGTC
ncbi:uncharacterized protein LOC108159803 [Drosophila miranda]|uniref:uncharacterized protein LOC108159803 n=1 Tax=Drosophila miranda TaxID=7229 RepID=UPI0007E77947|nr:uncharacterized protein LOC108159803 [Drosophila miranda]